MADPAAPPVPLTIGALCLYHGVPLLEGEAEQQGEQSFPDWPPDLFAICAALLKRSGAYTAIPGRLDGHETHDGERNGCIRRMAVAWGKHLEDPHAPPVYSVWGAPPLSELCLLWLKLWSHRTLALFKLADRRAVCAALIDLMAVADETCAGLGLPVLLSGQEDDSGKRDSFHDQAEQILFPGQFGSTLCKRVHSSVARVLPKMHTAQSGLTIRSFSHHLTFCEADEVRPFWISVPGSRGDARDITHMNVLIAPWPQSILPTQIRQTKVAEGASSNHFEVEIEDTAGKVAELLAALADQARKVVGSVDAVILPELALTPADHQMVRAALLSKGIMVIAGVGSRDPAANYLLIDVPISRYHAVQFRQRKQHRWKLDEAQIEQYHLGSRLHPEKRYWENIELQDRRLQFVVIRPWLVTTALICEDLARHDPVGDLIRSVGPNLVIALLMDGPQISGRWSARYAAGLADDPGCSVLSITSLGMAALSRPPGIDTKKKRVIGLWKDAFSGVTELEVPEGSDGLVITLTMRMREEKTADSRTDHGMASYPSLSAFHAIKLPAAESIPRLAQPLTMPGTLSAAEASFLARLAQRPAVTARDDCSAARGSLHPDFMPPELSAMQGTAFRIGREIWRRRTGGAEPAESDPSAAFLAHTLEDQWASEQERHTAGEIITWHLFNQKQPDLESARSRRTRHR